MSIWICIYLSAAVSLSSSPSSPLSFALSLSLSDPSVSQDPVLFSGTVRTNMDPFGMEQEADVLTALKRVGLSDFALEYLLHII